MKVIVCDQCGNRTTRPIRMNAPVPETRSSGGQNYLYRKVDFCNAKCAIEWMEQRLAIK